MSFNILQYTRKEAYAYAQQGGLNIKSGLHWDVCNDLKNGSDRETVAQRHRLSLPGVDKIRRCKCPDVTFS